MIVNLKTKSVCTYKNFEIYKKYALNILRNKQFFFEI